MAGKASSGKRTGAGRGPAARLWGGMGLLFVGALWLTAQFIEPGPPRSIVLATGGASGAYHAFGRRYADELAKVGIDVVLRETAGSIENVALLRAGEVDVAFVQGGVLGAAGAPDPEAPALQALASLYFEPLWIFHRAELPVERLADLAGAAVGTGPPGSGSRAVARDLLAAAGVGEAQGARFDERPTAEAVDALLAGELDAVLFVAAASSAHVARLMAVEGQAVRLLDVSRSLAWERRFKHLHAATLARGVIDLARDVPDRDVRLLAPAAGLLATEDLHPSLAQVFIQAARELHGQGDIFEDVGDFPSTRYLEVPLAPAAARFYAEGASFLYRVLPFQAAAVADRLKLLLLPLLTLLLPLLRVGPPLLRWRIRSRIYKWYRLLREIDLALRHDRGAERAPLLARLDAIDREIDEVVVPPSYGEEYYNLRLHVDRLREALSR